MIAGVFLLLMAALYGRAPAQEQALVRISSYSYDAERDILTWEQSVREIGDGGVPGPPVVESCTLSMAERTVACGSASGSVPEDTLNGISEDVTHFVLHLYGLSRPEQGRAGK